MAYVVDSRFDAYIATADLGDLLSSAMITAAKQQAEAWAKVLEMKYRDTMDAELVGYYATQKAFALAATAALVSRLNPEQYPPSVKEAVYECREIMRSQPNELAGGINQRRIRRGN